MTYISTYSVNFNEMTLFAGDFITESMFENTLDGNDSFSNDGRMTFRQGGFDIDIDFDMVVTAERTYDRGDYMTPASSSCDTNVDITITGIMIDEIEVNLSLEMIAEAKKLVLENL